MVEVTTDDKKLWGKIADAMMKKDSFQILVKKKKTKVFKKAYDLYAEYSKTKNFFTVLRCFFYQLRISSVWSVLMAAELDYEVKILSIKDDILVSAIPKQTID